MRKRLWLLIGTLVGVVLVAGLVLWFVVRKGETQYFPYLRLDTTAARKRLPVLGLDCPEHQKPHLLESDKRWPPPFVFLTCTTSAPSASKTTVSLLGDDRRHIYAIDIAMRGTISRLRLANLIVKLLPEDLPSKDQVWLRESMEVYSTRRTRRLAMQLTKSTGTAREYLIEAADITPPIPPVGRSLGDSLGQIDLPKLARLLSPTFIYHADDFRPMSIEELKRVSLVCVKSKSGRGSPTGCRPFSEYSTSRVCKAEACELPTAPVCCELEWILDIPWPAVESNPAAYYGLESQIRSQDSKPTVYWHAAKMGPYRWVLQYWVYYLFNDWKNSHEGDWETVQVDLLGTESKGLVYVARWFYSAHESGTVHNCSAVNCEGSPTVYVAKGSHANYAEPRKYDVEVTCAGSTCVRVRGEDDAKGTVPLAPEAYRLVELKGPAFTGRYGPRNRLPRLPDSEAPSDPRAKAEWAKDPLDAFATAPGGRPDFARIIYIDGD